MEQLKRFRYLHGGDEAGRLELERLGYAYRGLDKKNFQKFVLTAPLHADGPEVEEALETTFG